MLFVTGNYSVYAMASPMLFDIVVEASKMVRVFIIFNKLLLISNQGSKCI
jgi:hypothetical protein